MEKRLGELNSENPEHIKYIEEFLWDYKKGKNESTIQSLIENGQLDAGVVTIDGVILAGNRRFRLLNEIRRNPSKYHTDIDKYSYFEAAIIDKKLDKKQILKFESFFQYGRDEKVDYGPIEKYLAVSEQKDEEFSIEEIYKNFQAIAKNEKKIKEWLETFGLMNEYLEHIEEPGIFTALDEREEHFLSLNGQLKQLEKRVSATTRNMWAYDDGDIAEYKIAAFDYIHRYVPVDIFRTLFKTFQDERLWKEFFSQQKRVMQEVELDTLDDYRLKNPNATEEELSETREHDFESKVKKDFDQAIRTQISIQADEDAGNRPIDILQKMMKQIDQFKESLKSCPDGFDNSQIVEMLVQIQKSVGRLKQKLD